MRALLIARNRHVIPPEMAVGLFPAFAGWREKYKSNMEVFFFFAGTQRQNRNSAVKANEKRTPVPEIN